jgi:hypothetical protein
MCTVSIVPRDDGFRLLCNRDELLSRPPAIPPRWGTMDGVYVAYPVDPQGLGSWIAVSEEGLAVAVMNRGPRAPEQRRSRGEIPLMLIGAESLAAVQRRLRCVNPPDYPGFVVVAAWFDRLLVGASNGHRLSILERPLTHPVMFTSSSIGDAEAEQIRLPLFQSMVVEHPTRLAGQRAFHDHQWTDRPELSVRMRRPDACTVSRTRIDVRGNRVALDYEPLACVS